MSVKASTTGSIKTRSNASCSSKKTSSSSASKLVAANARAEAEAARTEAAFAAKENELKLKQAELELENKRLEMTLDKVRLDKRAAATAAKADVLEAAVLQELEQDLSDIDVPTDDPKARTKDYVEVVANSTPAVHIDSAPVNIPHVQTSEYAHTVASYHTVGPSKLLPHQNCAPPYTQHTQTLNPPITQGIIEQCVQQPQHPGHMPAMTPHSEMAHQPLGNGYSDTAHSKPLDNPCLPHSAAYQHPGPVYTQYSESRGMSDFVRFMARRELISTGLMQFNDRPECFRAWRASFMNSIRDLNLSASEQLDLLVKWLGKDSAEHVRRIRTVHVNHPEYGLRAVWDRLYEYYGAPEVIESSLFKRLESFPKIQNKDGRKLRELGDLLTEIQAAKADGDLFGLSYLDTPRGVNPIVQKLPFYLQEKWLTQGFNYKVQHRAPYPPFSFFVNFVCQQARMRNDPGFTLAAPNNEQSSHNKPAVKLEGQRAVAVLKTGVTPNAPIKPSESPSVDKPTSREDPAKHCLLHDKPHPLHKCRGFRDKPIEERKALLKKHGVCYKCCKAIHLAKNCNDEVSCTECGSNTHVAALHPGPPQKANSSADPAPDDGGETTVSSSCTKVCGKDVSGRSCSKICLVKVYPATHSDAAVRMYAILDDQSNRSLVRSEFFSVFNILGRPSPYSLKTCAGTIETEGRQARGFVVEPIDGSVALPLPPLIECNEIPNNRTEIPTPEVASSHAHLKHLGWVIVGDVCMGDMHKPPLVHSYYTNVLRNGRPSLFQPCPNSYTVKERYCDTEPPSHSLLHRSSHTKEMQNTSESGVFQTTKDDDKEAPSIEDLQFLSIMDHGVYKDDENSWVAPLPFRVHRPQLPGNRAQAQERLNSLQRSFKRKPEMKEQFVTFMEKIFQNGHAELAPPLKPGEEHWYLPCFGVYHPKKPSQIRVVFDSSAQHKGLSLNQVLLTGPDLNNSLIGVLLRFRKEQIAFSVDIQQMFHCFKVKPEHRNFLRFLWFKDNDPDKEISEYHMNVHVFGNSPSPAVAIYCLRRAAHEGHSEYGEDAQQFVSRDFYVDDGLKSLPTAEQVISLLKRTQSMLACSNLRLHKLASNSKEVMEAFPCEDHATDLKDLDLAADDLPVQRSLGLHWDLESDCFTYRVEDERKPFTRRGVLSTVNSLYDPLGFISPVTIQGKALLRELTTDSPDWDAPLPAEKEKLWDSWRDSLLKLEKLRIPRAYTGVSLSTAERVELCVFSDASEKAVAAVAYVRTVEADGQCHTGLISSKARLAPRPEHTIPRLELCGAVMAVDLAETIMSEIDITFDAVTFYTDSRIVLGYIFNEKRRFYVYVSNRVQRIRRSTLPQQWRYVHTQHNPADIATRSIPSDRLKDTMWFTGPAFLCQPDVMLSDEQTFELLQPEQDVEIRPQVTTLSTTVLNHLGSQRFSRFSRWHSLTRAVGVLIHIIQCFRKDKNSGPCQKWHLCHTSATVDVLNKSAAVIIRTVQQEAFEKELQCLASHANIPKSSPLWSLDPFLDQAGLLRVGGRLAAADLGPDEKRPLILPGRHHVATLIVRHFHEKTQHQGRHFTEGAIRSAGYWILGGKRCINRVIFECIVCRKLRGKCEVQKMADLPPDRLSAEPPFTNVGTDVFGPWAVAARRTRGGHAESKRWAVLFTCLSVRAIHIETIESMDSSSFINALRRFQAIRGPVKHLRSDRGTNFIGASKDLEIPSNADEKAVERFLSDQGTTWTFNAPHSSHMGGAWERMIGITRRILDSMLMQMGSSKLTHEVLTTFLAEVTAIVNNRPLVPVSTDPTDPFILTPASLLTQKVGPCPPPPGDFDHKDLYKQQWRRVQSLSNTFWDRWRKQYLATLQPRRKWSSDQPNLAQGSVVLLKDMQCKRNDWPLGIITDVYPSEDGRVRKVQLRVARKDGTKLFLRPVNELILLIPPDK